MAGYAFPHAAGVKLAGSNLCVRRSDIDAYNKDQTIDPWYLMLYDWGKGEGAVRESWIRPQLNALQSIGANCVRLIMSPLVRVGKLPTLSQAEWFSVLDEFAADCAARNLWWYVTLGDARLLNLASALNGVDAGSFNSYLAEMIDRANQYTNVLGFDLVQEILADGIGSFAHSHMAMWFDVAKGARQRRERPLTCSYFIVNGREEFAPEYAWPGIKAAGAEIRDIHIYLQPEVEWLRELLDDPAPLFIGETGIQDDGSYLRGAPSTVRKHYEVMARWTGQAELQGLLTWAVVHPTTGWGMFADTQSDDFAFTMPRSDKTAPFQTFQKTVQPHKRGDRGAAVPGIPTVMRNEGAIDLTWRRAEGGNGAHVYIPQYVEEDGHGFPKTEWSSAPPTTDRNVLITGLDPYAAYLLRIKVMDSGNPPVTNYSSWQFAVADPPRRVFFIRQ